MFDESECKERFVDKQSLQAKLAEKDKIIIALKLKIAQMEQMKKLNEQGEIEFSEDLKAFNKRTKSKKED